MRLEVVQVLADRIVHSKAAPVLQRKHKSRTERFAHRGDVEPGLRSIGYIKGKIGHSVATAEKDLAILGDSHCSTKEPRVCGSVQVLINTTSNFILLGWVLREAES